MPIYEKCKPTIYRVENGVHTIYTQSFVPELMVPFFLKNHYAFPSLLLYNEDGSTVGRVEVNRFFYQNKFHHSSNEDLTNILREITASYILPYLDKIISIPFMIKNSVFTIKGKVITGKNGSTQFKVIDNEQDYGSYLHRFDMNKSLVSYFGKFYKDTNYRKLFTMGADNPTKEYDVAAFFKQ